MFQLGKILLASLIATYGSTAIAANAVANTVATFQTIPGTAMSLALITVAGQCVGAGEFDQATRYTKKLLLIAHLSMLALNAVILAGLPLVLKLYNLSAETAGVARQLLIMHGIVVCVIWPESFTLPNALRAASDIKSTLIISILSMWLCRIMLGYALGTFFGMGVVGVWIAMFMDWLVRSVCFILRYRTGKWKTMLR